MANLTGLQMYALAATMNHNFQMDKTMFYAHLNSARTIREMSRPFMRLRKLNSSLVGNASDRFVPGVNAYAKAMPTDFQMLTKEATIVLFDGNQTWLTYNEVPQDLQVQYKDMSNRFFIDHANQTLTLLGILDRTYNIFLFYQADYGDITDTTTWVNIPGRYHAMLVYDVLAMYELGNDYDSINSRNANQNVKNADLLFNAMCAWDDNLQRSSVTTLDYPVIGDTPSFTSGKINMGNSGE